MVQHAKGNLRLAPCLMVMEAEANRLAPSRSKASDGSFPSAAHTAANPTSDHETGDALDLTHDPSEFDVAVRFHLIVARRDPRVSYLIHNGTVWRSYVKPGIPAWTPAPYTGPNPHRSHGHVSVVYALRDDTAPWWPAVAPATPPPTLSQEDVMLITRQDNTTQALLFLGGVLFEGHNGAVKGNEATPKVSVSADVWGDIIAKHGPVIK